MQRIVAGAARQGHCSQVRSQHHASLPVAFHACTPTLQELQRARACTHAPHACVAKLPWTHLSPRSRPAWDACMPAHSSPCPFISACRRPVLGGRAAYSVRPSVSARASSSASSAFGLHPAPVASGSSLRPRSLAISAAACRRGNTVIVTAALVRTFRAPPCNFVTHLGHGGRSSSASQPHPFHGCMHVTLIPAVRHRCTWRAKGTKHRHTAQGQGLTTLL